MKRVCFVGASTVEGMGDEQGLGWPGRLALLMSAEGRPIVPYNLGVRGQTLKQIAARAQAECQVRLVAPGEGMIVLGTGANDLARIESGLPRTPRRRVLADFAALVEVLSQLAPLLVVGPFPVAEAKMPFYSAVSGMSFDFRNEDIREAAEGYGEVCAERQVPFLDLYSNLASGGSYIQGLENSDGLHSDGQGYQAVARLLLQWPAWRERTS